MSRKVVTLGALLGGLFGQYAYVSYINTNIDLYYVPNQTNLGILRGCPSLTVSAFPLFKGHFYPSIWSCCALAGLLYANLIE